MDVDKLKVWIVFGRSEVLHAALRSHKGHGELIDCIVINSITYGQRWVPEMIGHKVVKGDRPGVQAWLTSALLSSDMNARMVLL